MAAVPAETAMRERKQGGAAFDENDTFLQSIRFLKGSLGLSQLKMERTPARQTAPMPFEESMLQSHFL